MRNGYIIDTLTSIDIQENVKIGRELIEIYEGVIYREKFKISLFRKYDGTIGCFKTKKHKEEHYDFLQGLVKLTMNNLYGAQIRKDINGTYCCKSENWMQTKYDEAVLQYWKLPNGN